MHYFRYKRVSIPHTRKLRLSRLASRVRKCWLSLKTRKNVLVRRCNVIYPPAAFSRASANLERDHRRTCTSIHGHPGWSCAKFSAQRNRLARREIESRSFVMPHFTSPAESPLRPAWRTCNIISRRAVCQVQQGRIISHAIWMHRENTSRISRASISKFIVNRRLGFSAARDTRIASRKSWFSEHQDEMHRNNTMFRCAQTSISHYIRLDKWA